MSTVYTIAGLAKAAAVNVETVRYYQRRGLLPEPERPLGEIRRYSEADADRLRFIRRAKAVGFTLAEIVTLLSLRARVCCSATRELAAAKVEVIDQRLTELQQLRSELSHWIADCDANATGVSCPVIEHLDAHV
ncbi:MerR family transcriptional regulator [Tahibacter sp.]|jgi:MerR family mercuric resistance operon transcriptional regulator|uniref:MerR family transcriptional regulator n=1 Tax=Tahibacter sp. TaxID=2056211 RepID=UPI0028C42F17|nr:MerR family transcriptional regulator [Tahibacter sp.]